MTAHPIECDRSADDDQPPADLSQSKTLVANSGTAAVFTGLAVAAALQEAAIIRDAVIEFLPFDAIWVKLVAYAVGLGFVGWSTWRRIDDARKGKR